MDFFAKKVDFRPFLAIFRYFPLLSVTSFTLKEGHNDRWSGQEYSRGPLETFILSFTRLILALEPKKWIFPQKGRFLPKNGPKMAIFWPFSEKSALGKQLKNLLESFLRHMFCFFVSQHIREGVDNLTWSLYLLTGEKFKKNPKNTYFFRFFGQNLKKSEKSKKIISGEKAQKCSRTLFTPYVSCVCVSACVGRCW